VDTTAEELRKAFSKWLKAEEKNKLLQKAFRRHFKIDLSGRDIVYILSGLQAATFALRLSGNTEQMERMLELYERLESLIQDIKIGDS
jgi:3-hydroxyisobutyrate dehydrogenase-like beta-hydroxyacid dehydrogenase